MQKLEFTYFQMVLIGIGVGVFFGLIPLVLGLIKKKIKLGVFGFLVSIVAGALWSLLSIVTAAVFAWLILKKPSAQDSAVSESTNETEVL